MAVATHPHSTAHDLQSRIDGLGDIRAARRLRDHLDVTWTEARRIVTMLRPRNAFGLAL